MPELKQIGEYVEKRRERERRQRAKYVGNGEADFTRKLGVSK